MMNRIKNAVLLLTVLGIAACSGDSPSSPLRVAPNGGANRLLYATLDDEINATIPMLFPNTGLTTATVERWEGVKSALSSGKLDVAKKMLTNLSTFIVKKTVPSQKTAASRLILVMALYVYNGPNTPPPAPGATLQTASGVVEPTTSLLLTTLHADLTTGDGGIFIDVGSVATTTIVVISEVTGDYSADCSGPLVYGGCQQPKFFRITLFPHDKLLKSGEVQICHVNTGEVRLPLGDHNDLRVAHEKPSSPSLYTPGSTIVDGIEILPFLSRINFLGRCRTTYDNPLPPENSAFLDRLIGPNAPLSRFASAIGSLLTPKSLQAIDLGGGGLFDSESIFGLVNPKIMLTDDPPTITSLSLNSPSITIDGAGTDYQAVVHNPGTSSEGWVLQGWIDQGSASRAAGGTMVQCGSGTGILPAGDCNSTFSVSVNNTTSDGSGLLVAGAATFRLQLTHNETLVDTRSVPITLVALAGPTITSLTLSSSDVVIDGPGTPYTAVMQNPGPSVSGIVLQGWLDQPGVSRPAGGIVALCGAGNGVLPTGSCTESFAVNANNQNGGPGVLVAGAATFRLELIKDGTVIDTKTATVNLILGLKP